MDRQVANEKKAREGASTDWLKTPGSYAKMDNVQWSDMQKPVTRAETASDFGAKVDGLLEWSAVIDRNIAEINWKLDLLLEETRKSRELESQETAMGTRLGNACLRLDSHHETIQGIGRRLASTSGQVHHLTNELRLLREEKEVTVTFKSGRK